MSAVNGPLCSPVGYRWSHPPLHAPDRYERKVASELEGCPGGSPKAGEYFHECCRTLVVEERR